MHAEWILIYPCTTIIMFSGFILMVVQHCTTACCCTFMWHELFHAYNYVWFLTNRNRSCLGTWYIINTVTACNINSIVICRHIVGSCCWFKSTCCIDKLRCEDASNIYSMFIDLIWWVIHFSVFIHTSTPYQWSSISDTSEHHCVSRIHTVCWWCQCNCGKKQYLIIIFNLHLWLYKYIATCKHFWKKSSKNYDMLYKAGHGNHRKQLKLWQQTLLSRFTSSLLTNIQHAVLV